MSSSILTNISAMSALQNLSATQKSMQTVQNQISSGLRVANASDNAAYWAIANTMKSDVGALSAVSDSLNLGSSTVGVATAALNTTLSVLNALNNDLVTAQTPGTDLTKIQTDVAAEQAQLKSIAGSASFNGVNLLQTNSGSTTTYTTTTSIVSSFSRSSTGAVTLGKISIDTTKTTLVDTTASGTNVGILSATGTNYTGGSILSFVLSSALTPTNLTQIQADIEQAIASVTTAGATLGATKTNIDSQSTFVKALSDAITSGVGSLVDADMNMASTRLQALQTQQQLGIQSLSIANQNTQLILKLFGG